MIALSCDWGKSVVLSGSILVWNKYSYLTLPCLESTPESKPYHKRPNQVKCLGTAYEFCMVAQLKSCDSEQYTKDKHPEKKIQKNT